MAKNKTNQKKELPAILRFISPTAAFYICAFLIFFLGGFLILF